LTLIEVVAYFSNEQRAFECVRDHRWPDGVKCPHCGSERVRFMANRWKWNCNGCRQQFTAKTKSIFEDSPLPFSKWIPALWLIVNAKNGISSYELHRALGVTQKTAWFMLHRLRLAMHNGSLERLCDNVEVDETYIGGKARNMHKSVRERKITGTGGRDKTVVFGMLERGGSVKTQVVAKTKKSTLQGIIHQNVLHGSSVYSDALRSYAGLDTWYEHQVIDHAVAYVDGIVHTNSLENYWSLLKRTLSGTYVSVEPFHLFRYLDEQSFRYNERKSTDSERFKLALSQVSGKRIMYTTLTGKELAAAAF
jgi:transposase-like protein